MESELQRAVRDYLRSRPALPGFWYADLHGTKHAEKFVLVEMYHDSTAACAGSNPLAHPGVAALVQSDSRAESVRPLLTCGFRHRGSPGPTATGTADLLSMASGLDHELCGAFVRVFADPARLDEFVRVLARQGEIVVAREPGFLYADFFALETPGQLLVVEYYRDRASLSHHHTLPHTLEFAARKAQAGFETAKHQAFTLRRLASVGFGDRENTPLSQGGNAVAVATP